MYLKGKAHTFYIYTSLFVIAGWLWFLWSFLYGSDSSGTVCLFRNITGYPCPTCGSTTSVEMIAKGDFAGAVGANPLGYLMAAGLLVLPVWLLFDIISGTRSMYGALKAIDKMIRRYPFLFPAIMLAILLSWILR